MTVGAIGAIPFPPLRWARAAARNAIVSFEVDRSRGKPRKIGKTVSWVSSYPAALQIAARLEIPMPRRAIRIASRSCPFVQ